MRWEIIFTVESLACAMVSLACAMEDYLHCREFGLCAGLEELGKREKGGVGGALSHLVLSCLLRTM